jgi:hypothetical protein
MALRLGVRMSLIPQTREFEHDPPSEVIERHALCSATREELQAVSRAREGPVKLNANEILPAATDEADPVAVYALI